MGLATAQLLASRGARISLADLNDSGLKTAVATLAGFEDRRHMYQVVDVRSTQSVDAWIDATVKMYGKLDGAVNMAGVITKAMTVDESRDEDWEFVMSVNATGVFKCLRAQIRAIKATGGVGSIVSVEHAPTQKLETDTRVLTGLCREHLWPDRGTGQCGLLRKQGSGDRGDENGSQGEPADPCQLRRSR